MIGKGSKLYSIFRGRCPHCHEGPFFQGAHPYDLAKVGEVHATCPACGTRNEPEPGFYYGAMYVAYALGVALFVTVYVATTVLYPQAGMWTVIGLILGSLLVFGPLMYALSKIIWANLFFTYKGAAGKVGDGSKG
jgi:uncharacterized protein (DUF983 family)